MTPLSWYDALINETRQVLQKAVLWREVAQAVRRDSQEIRSTAGRLRSANRHALQ